MWRVANGLDNAALKQQGKLKKWFIFKLLRFLFNSHFVEKVIIIIFEANIN
jgi:hypothetical protein